MTLLAKVVLIALLAASLAEVALADEATNEALARRFYAAVNARNLDALNEFVSPNFVDHNAQPGAPQGLEGLKAGLKPFLAASSNLKITNGPIVTKGDYVTVVDTAKGTNDGPMMGSPATNRPFEFQAIDLWLVKDGKLSEVWHVEELLQMTMQLNPAPAK